MYLGRLAVDAAWRGRDLALQRVMRSRQQGRDSLELQTRVELVENHCAFAALGFVKVGESAHPGCDRPTSITMRESIG